MVGTLQEIEPDDLSGEAFVPYRKRWRTPEAKPEEVTNDTKAEMTRSGGVVSASCS